jgi:phosphoribosylaminoimidazole-succinocarboxamide synthase
VIAPPPLLRRGKVREMYVVDDARLLMVASDRVSAFDVVMAEPIPGKGRVLTRLSKFWFDRTRNVVANHLISDDPTDLPNAVRAFAAEVPERWLLVKRAERIDIECVVRGYLAGSGWTEYQRTSTLAEEPLPAGMQESQRLEQPVFTPAIKAESGHDENISRARLAAIVGPDLARALERLSLALYTFGAAYAQQHGLLLADTKFEFGHLDGELILIDEALTPDSSRYWPADDYTPGRAQASFDKQFLRDYLERGGWNKLPPPPPLPPEVVDGTARRYAEALQRLTP